MKNRGTADGRDKIFHLHKQAAVTMRPPRYSKAFQGNAVVLVYNSHLNEAKRSEANGGSGDALRITERSVTEMGMGLTDSRRPNIKMTQKLVVNYSNYKCKIGFLYLHCFSGDFSGSRLFGLAFLQPFYSRLVPIFPARTQIQKNNSLSVNKNRVL